MNKQQREEWIEKKAKTLYEIMSGKRFHLRPYSPLFNDIKDFIRNLLIEAPMRKPKVSREFVQTMMLETSWANKLKTTKEQEDDFIHWLIKAGVEVEK